MTAEDIKRICLGFKTYCDQYHSLYDNELAEGKAPEMPQIKTDEELYEDYTNGKPVILERKRETDKG